MVVLAYKTGTSGDWLVAYLRLKNVHEPTRCYEEVCAIHAPTSHHMRWWPPMFNPSTGLIFRFCPHDVAHPDPDSAAWVERHSGEVLHRCECSCCSGSFTI